MKSILLSILSMLVLGLALNNTVNASETETVKLTAPSAKVQALINKHDLQIVDYEYTKDKVANGTRTGAKALLIDARPNTMYVKGTIPSSINIPDNKIPEYIYQLAAIAQDKEIIVYCGGWGCSKSPKVAGYLKGMGYSDVKLYQAGEPEWKKMSYLEISVPVVASILENDSALLMDARPRKSYLAETIPGAMYMNNTELEKLSARFPADKSTPIVPFCGGYGCSKSHIVAEALLALNYTNVRVFSGGLPAWKKADMSTTASAKKQTMSDEKPEKVVFVDGVMSGMDEGTVDGEWLNKLISENKVPANVVLVDVRSPEDFKAGHIKGATNIVAEELTADQLAFKTSMDKVIVFYCASGARAMEAYLKLADAKKDVSKVMYFDAVISCNSDQCGIEVNEPLG